ncbi:thioredoxin family protein [Trichothermofontia sp.]
MLSVNDKKFKHEVLESPIPVLVNFWAPWCGLCRLVEPSLQDLQAQWIGQVKLVSVNADENFRLATTYRLRNLPTLLLIDRGQVIHRFDSFNGRDDLRLTLNYLLQDCIRIEPPSSLDPRPVG